MQVLKMSELKLGDVVKVFDGAFGTAVVKQVINDTVTFYRPYGTHADFTYTAGVICYTGLEVYAVPINDEHTWEVYHRATNLK